MSQAIVLSDASVNIEKRLGVGACLILTAPGFNDADHQSQIQFKKFLNTTSTQLEIETIIWAMTELPRAVLTVTFYTDCQNVLSLLSRRTRLESQHFITKAGTPHKHMALYRRFFSACDQRPCEFIKLKGHVKKNKRTEIDEIFSMVDKAARKTLRQWVNSVD